MDGEMYGGNAKSSMLERMVGAALFRSHIYEEIEADATALGQAFGIVLLVTACAIAGGILDQVLSGETFTTLGIVLAVVGGLFFGVVFWAFWVTLLLMVGGGLMRTATTHTSWSELGRVVGFAYTPRALTLLSFIPEIWWLFTAIGFLWTMAGVVVAVRHAMDFESVGRAVVVVLITGILGAIPWLIIFTIEWILLLR